MTEEEKETYQKALSRASRYCAEQDRAISDIQKKMHQWEIPEDMQERVIEKLIGEGFIDEWRFACTFARSKFHYYQWGRIKIAHALRRKNVPEQYISESLKEIGHQEYEDTLRELIHKKYSSVKGASAHEKKQKTAQSMAAKGFESDLVFELIFNQEII